MTIEQAWQRVMWITVLASGLFVFASFLRYAHQPATMTDVIRASAVMPYTFDQNIPEMLPKAAACRLNYLDETGICLLYSAGKSRSVATIRIWDGIVAAFVIWWLYRVGSLCVDRLTAMLGCVILALLPPQSWYMDSLRILVVLWHFEAFLYAVRKDNIPRWTIYAVTTLLLFCTGVYAESMFLSRWFITLGLIWAAWRLGSRRLVQGGTTGDSYARRPRSRHESSLWKQLQRDSGLLRFVTLLVMITFISFCLVFVTGVFFSKFSLTINLILTMIAVSLTLSTLSAVVMLVIPTFVRERGIILDHMLVGELVRSFSNPDQVFRPVRLNSVFRAFAAYTLASCFFLPVLFIIRNDIPVDSGGNVVAFVSRLASRGSVWEWFLFVTPMLLVLTNLLGYLGGMFTRGRLIGSCAVFLPACLYVFHQRYAVFSTPFCILALAGFGASACRIVFQFIDERITSSVRERLAHDI